jgi:hypothetical protein
LIWKGSGNRGSLFEKYVIWYNDGELNNLKLKIRKLRIIVRLENQDRSKEHNSRKEYYERT